MEALKAEKRRLRLDIEEVKNKKARVCAVVSPSVSQLLEAGQPLEVKASVVMVDNV